MRDKLGMAAFVAVLITVWVAGFFWVRGDFSAPRSTSAGTAEAAAAATGTSSPSASPSPSVTLTDVVEVPSPDSVPTGKRVALGTGKAVEAKPDAPRPRPELLPPVAEFKVASFNILGSSHTRGGGHAAKMASGTERMGGVLQLLGIHDISVVGIQEFQPDQRQAFQSRAGGWSLYPGLRMGRRAGENSVAWRTDTWEEVEAHTIDIPYFGGRQRPMPYVLLRHRATGIKSWFSTFHNPADVHGPAQRWREEGTRREIGLFNRLEATGIPQFATGDMNERQAYACRVTGGTALVPAQGGSCPPSSPVGIDWILGSPKVEFTGYVSDRGDLVRRTSDHPLLVSSVSIDGLAYPKAVDPVD